jgi:D-alanyl-D-alanine carboxypeptidase/D-alanyl-D-alanine-endopeptidase (penicillin-binding protein 4)
VLAVIASGIASGIASSLLSLFLNHSPKVEPLQAVPWSSFLNTALLRSLTQPDPDAVTIIQQQLKSLGSLGYSTNAQGIWMQEEEQMLADHLGTTAIPAASLTKVATTLVALSTWGADHQFNTLVSTTGSIQGGVLKGDLIVQGEGDPFFVWEEAVALGNALNQAGINQVTGNLLIAGNFAMNYEVNPRIAGNFLKQGLDPNLWNGEVKAQFEQMPAGTPRPQVKINGGVQVIQTIPPSRPLIRHQSMQLVGILKAMNIYSNNIMSEMMADLLGGAPAIAKKAAEVAQVPAIEITLENGSGLGTNNQISPRAVTQMMLTIQGYLQDKQLNVGNLFPVMGRDVGTLKGRSLPANSVVKTGTLNEVSALAGVVPTRDRGLIWFTIINYGAGDLRIFHNQQDVLLQRLQQKWGVPAPVPSAVQPSDRANNSLNRLGAPERNQLL